MGDFSCQPPGEAVPAQSSSLAGERPQESSSKPAIPRSVPAQEHRKAAVSNTLQEAPFDQGAVESHEIAHSIPGVDGLP